MAGIEVKNLQKTYTAGENSLDVLNGVNLHIPEKSITVVLGRSGCGKTTLLRLVGGLESADMGEINFDEAHRSTFVFQEARLMPWLTVWDNVRFGLKNQEEKDAVIQSIIETVGLKGFEKAYPNQLSGGMQQRVAIARALAYEPSFIMMDEPFAALDYFTREQMQRELLRLQKKRGISILFVTHSIDEALLLGDKIVVLEEGRIKAEFTVGQEKAERNLLDEQFIILKKQIIQQLA